MHQLVLYVHSVNKTNVNIENRNRGGDGMKLVNAKLYEEQIKRRLWDVWYDEKYQYFWGGSWRSDFSLNDNNNEWPRRAFAVLDNADELIGYICYSVDTDLRVAQWFGAINFSNDKITFGRALCQVIDDCFIKFGMNVLEWNVICGNPIERSYDRMCQRLGGHIIGVRHNRSRDLAGNPLNEKAYEILREDYLRAVGKAEKEEDSKSKYDPYPILGSGPQQYIPRGLLIPHESQAWANHGQSLSQLAQRGGLSWVEALAIIEDKKWRDVEHDEKVAESIVRKMAAEYMKG